MVRSVVLILAMVVVAGAALGGEPPVRRPNVLWITAEDMSAHLGCYGDSHAVTPTLDRLAAEGLRYTRAFATASVCTPARSCLITGVYASSLGTQHLRGPAQPPEQIRPFTEYLRRSGYYCSNNVKEDYNFKAPGAWDESSARAHWRKRKAGQPFFSVFNFMTTHQSRVRYSAEQFARVTAALPPGQRQDPARLPLPPYYPDTPVVRRIMAQLYTQVTLMDKQVAGLLEQLDADGLADDTIVFFYADHGTGLPRGKRWLHHSGVHVPMIIRFPRKYRQLAPGEPGTTCDRLVSFVDFAPTVLSLAGVKIPDYVQGRAFLGPVSAEPRKHVFAMRDRVDEVYEFSRTVRGQRYQYIRNYMPHRPRMQHSTFSERTPIRQELRRLHADGKLRGTAAWLMSPVKPAEELYDTHSDPHQINNLAGSPQHEDILKRLRGELRAWMIRTRDTGLLAEVEMWRRTGDGSPYTMARTPGKFDLQRILAAAELIGRDSTTAAQLQALLADSDAGVRFWAATGLIAIGPRGGAAAGGLAGLLDDPAPNVRFAAAEALCKLNREQDALPVLVDGLTHPDARTRMQASITMAAIGQKARPATTQINKALAAEQAQSDFKMFTRWALERALANLQ